MRKTPVVLSPKPAFPPSIQHNHWRWWHRDKRREEFVCGGQTKLNVRGLKITSHGRTCPNITTSHIQKKGHTYLKMTSICPRVHIFKLCHYFKYVTDIRRHHIHILSSMSWPWGPFMVIKDLVFFTPLEPHFWDCGAHLLLLWEKNLGWSWELLS